jgi:hypothetical protein
MMWKVYLKGDEEPGAVIGSYLYEDERWLVLDNHGVKLRLPWRNIRYVEEFGSAPSAEPQAAEKPAPPQPKPLPPQSKPQEQSQPRRKMNVEFVGYKNQSFTVEVDGSVEADKYSPQLSREIFMNPQIKAFMGDFVMTGSPEVDGANVRIQTLPTQDKFDGLKNKVEAAQQLVMGLAAAGEKKFSPPASKFDVGFAMTGSPFQATVRLQDEADYADQET